MSVLMMYIVKDETCSSLSGLTKNVLLYCLTTKTQLSLHEIIAFKLPTIICVIQGTSQTESKSNWSLFVDYRLYFFSELRSHGLEEEGHDLGTL